jgi:hypothetical protein
MINLYRNAENNKPWVDVKIEFDMYAPRFFMACVFCAMIIGAILIKAFGS